MVGKRIYPKGILTFLNIFRCFLLPASSKIALTELKIFPAILHANVANIISKTKYDSLLLGKQNLSKEKFLAKSQVNLGPKFPP